MLLLLLLVWLVWLVVWPARLRLRAAVPVAVARDWASSLLQAEGEGEDEEHGRAGYPGEDEVEQQRSMGHGPNGLVQERHRRSALRGRSSRRRRGRRRRRT